MAPERIDARDVLDPNAKTASAFRARITGRFVRSGPNAWDDYVFRPAASGVDEIIEIMAGVPVQVETAGAFFRMRRRGDVLRLEWLPEEVLQPEADRRVSFLARCVHPWDEEPGRGAAAVIAEKLSERAPKPSLD
jgi:hypothetical protein